MQNQRQQYEKNRFKCNCYIYQEKGDILEYTARIDRNGYKYYSSCMKKTGCCNKQ